MLALESNKHTITSLPENLDILLHESNHTITLKLNYRNFKSVGSNFMFPKILSSTLIVTQDTFNTGAVKVRLETLSEENRSSGLEEQRRQEVSGHNITSSFCCNLARKLKKKSVSINSLSTYF